MHKKYTTYGELIDSVLDLQKAITEQAESTHNTLLLFYTLMNIRGIADLITPEIDDKLKEFYSKASASNLNTYEKVKLSSENLLKRLKENNHE